MLAIEVCVRACVRVCVCVGGGGYVSRACVHACICVGCVYVSVGVGVDVPQGQINQIINYTLLIHPSCSPKHLSNKQTNKQERPDAKVSQGAIFTRF